MNENTFFIPLDPSVSFTECLWFLNRDLNDCLHMTSPDSVRKALMIDNQAVLIDISHDQDQLRIHILQGISSPQIRAVITSYIRDWFDLERDMTPFYKLLKQNKRLSYMADDFSGLRLIGIPDLFEALCWAITGQQINLAFAYKIKRRLVERYGTRLEHGNTIHYVFPTAQVLADARMEDLREMQFSGKKAEYLMGVAQAFASGKISKRKLLDLPDFASRQKVLTSMRGIGIWTANYAMMKSMKEQTCIPFGDAGLLNALISHGIIKKKDEVPEIQEFFKNFSGWESYLVFYLWRSLTKQKTP